MYCTGEFDIARRPDIVARGVCPDCGGADATDCDACDGTGSAPICSLCRTACDPRISVRSMGERYCLICAGIEMSSLWIAHDTARRTDSEMRNKTARMRRLMLDTYVAALQILGPVATTSDGGTP